MKHLDYMHSSLPLDIALKIASSLQVLDLCSLGCCSKFWREVCGSDCLWESLSRERWPSFHGKPHLHNLSSSEGWRRLYINQHHEMAGKVASVVEFVQQSSLSDFLEVGEYLRAIHDLHFMQLELRDVELFLFRPSLSVFLNLAGLHYCITWLQVPAIHVLEALQHCEISERQVCVRWWKLGRWFYGYRMRDESHVRRVSLADLATSKETEAMAVLHRGAIHEVLRVQISSDNSASSPCPSHRTHSWHIM